MTDVRRHPGAEAAILGEVPNVTGLVLWQNWRYLRDWLSASRDARARLFPEILAQWVVSKRADARAEAPALVPALAVWDEWVRSPLTMQTVRLSNACEFTAGWAVERGYTTTALLFAEAAAQLEPQDPRRALLAGKLSRSVGQTVRAERWFNASISVARESEQWEEYIRGHLGLGILFMLMKKDARARAHFSAASTRANRHGYEWLAGEAQHDLFQFMTVRGKYDAAELHARTALSWYPKNNPRVPYLAADVAYLLICRTRYSEAIELLRAFLRLIKSPPHNVLGLSMFVRALAAAGHPRKFLRMRRRLLDVELGATPYEAAALMASGGGGEGHAALGSRGAARTLCP